MDAQQDVMAAREALAALERATAGMRRCLGATRSVERLAADLRRMAEDLDDVATDAGLPVAGFLPEAAHSQAPVTSAHVTETVFVSEASYAMSPSLDDDDEGLGVPWHASGPAPRRPRRPGT